MTPRTSERDPLGAGSFGDGWAALFAGGVPGGSPGCGGKPTGYPEASA
ncbi:MAG: hypothetical protein LBQ79_01135 [Deltaproteobacteria bacterium]|nr:hypothetical protein [Deltaproteobacteria bacterium]